MPRPQTLKKNPDQWGTLMRRLSISSGRRLSNVSISMSLFDFDNMNHASFETTPADPFAPLSISEGISLAKTFEKDNATFLTDRSESSVPSLAASSNCSSVSQPSPMPHTSHCRISAEFGFALQSTIPEPTPIKQSRQHMQQQQQQQQQMGRTMAGFDLSVVGSSMNNNISPTSVRASLLSTARADSLSAAGLLDPLPSSNMACSTNMRQGPYTADMVTPSPSMVSSFNSTSAAVNMNRNNLINNNMNTTTAAARAAIMEATPALDFTGADQQDDPELDSQRFKPFHEEKWSNRYKELLVFVKEHGHAAVPHTYPQNPQLARWVKRQRRQYKLRQDHRPSTMTAERLELLHSVGFVWDSHDVNWREKLQALDNFRASHGHCNVPSNYTDKKLATWVKCQRRQYKLYWDGKASAMSPDRIKELEKRGFEWEIRPAGSRSSNGGDRSPPAQRNGSSPCPPPQHQQLSVNNMAPQRPMSMAGAVPQMALSSIALSGAEADFGNLFDLS